MTKLGSQKEFGLQQIISLHFHPFSIQFSTTNNKTFPFSICMDFFSFFWTENSEGQLSFTCQKPIPTIFYLIIFQESTRVIGKVNQVLAHQR